MESGVSAGQLSRLVSCARSTTASMIERMADGMMLRITIEPKTKQQKGQWQSPSP